MKKYSGYIDGIFEYYTGVAAKSEKKAKKKAADELRDKLIEKRIGTINKKIEVIAKKDLEDFLALFEMIGIPQFDYFVRIKGVFNYSDKVKAKNSDKAKDKLVEKLFKKCDSINLGVATESISLVNIEDEKEEI